MTSIFFWGAYSFLVFHFLLSCNYFQQCWRSNALLFAMGICFYLSLAISSYNIQMDIDLILKIISRCDVEKDNKSAHIFDNGDTARRWVPDLLQKKKPAQRLHISWIVPNWFVGDLSISWIDAQDDDGTVCRCASNASALVWSFAATTSRVISCRAFTRAISSSLV